MLLVSDHVDSSMAELDIVKYKISIFLLATPEITKIHEVSTKFSALDVARHPMYSLGSSQKNV